MKLSNTTASIALLATIAVVSPTASWWQFVSLGPNGLREVHSPYKDEASCQAALKKLEAEMKKRLPNQFPLVGSCEEYQSEK